MVRKYTVVTVKILEEIRRLNAAGVDDKQIGIELGMCQENVRRHRISMGLPNFKQVKKQLREQDEKAVQRPNASRVTQKKKHPEIKLVDEYCEGCIYHTDFCYDDVKHICYYNVINDKKRPCKAGQGCTVKCVGKRRAPPVDLW